MRCRAPLPQAPATHPAKSHKARPRGVARHAEGGDPHRAAMGPWRGNLGTRRGLSGAPAPVTQAVSAGDPAPPERLSSNAANVIPA